MKRKRKKTSKRKKKSACNKRPVRIEAPLALETVKTNEALNFFELVFSTSTHVTATEQTSKLFSLSKKQILCCTLPFAILSLILLEFKYSFIQSHTFYSLAKKASFSAQRGEGTIQTSPPGPYDTRFGYTELPKFKDALINNGFAQTFHTKTSDVAKRMQTWGVNIPYWEKSQAGLFIRDALGRPIFSFKEPNWEFPRFEELSPLIVNTLLFIENRSLLSPASITNNPAVEWPRFFKASSDLVLQKVLGSRDVPGGSTLATQLEKFRHSKGGLTLYPTDKLKQMASASLRVYLHGRDTTHVRKQIILDYINSVPLAALSGYGEIHGLGDGLWAYYAENPITINSLLSQPDHTLNEESLREKAAAYRKVLSLFLAHRRPSDYLNQNPAELHKQVDQYLPILFKNKVISYRLYRYALEERSYHRRTLPQSDPVPFTKRKAPNVVRNTLLSHLNMSSLYELDRIDMQASSSINIEAQEAVTRTLLELTTADGIRKHSLNGYRMLNPSVDPSKVIFSMTLFERLEDRNELRIQTDTFNQPFNINQGVKLDLGSTAKFRMLITYLQAIEKAFYKFSHMSQNQRGALLKKRLDPIRMWILRWIKRNPKGNIHDILDSALERSYSANPQQRFFTAGGIHRFSNFNHKFDAQTVTLKKALRHSINLPFIRMTKDLVAYFGYTTQGATLRNIDSMKESTRRDYLKRFADQEGKVFIRRFYKKYEGLTSEQIVEKLLSSVRHSPQRFAGIFWFLHPDAGVDAFIAFMKKHIDHAAISQKHLEKYYKQYSSLNGSLADQGYVARMHPLELLVAAHLLNDPQASLGKIFRESTEERVAVYEWLLNTSRKKAQDKRIKIILETEAFEHIHDYWKRLGYPLPSLVPSLATSLGTSADRPAALATLMGIVISDGFLNERTMLRTLSFAKSTPYETHFSKTPKEPKRVMSLAVAEIAQKLLFDVASKGTARRLKDGLTIGENTYTVGGKTGTGDHRYQVFNAHGKLLRERVVNRTATFMFILGEKYFGVISAFVPGQEASQYRFTSAVPVQLLKILEPALQPLER